MAPWDQAEEVSCLFSQSRIYSLLYTDHQVSVIYQNHSEFCKLKKQGILWQSWEQTEVSVKDAVSIFSALFLEKNILNDFIKTSGCTNWLRYKILIKRYHYLPAEYALKWLKEYTHTSVYMYMFINYVHTLTSLNSFICCFVISTHHDGCCCCFMFPSTPAFTNIGALGFFTNLHKHVHVIQNITTK